MTIKFSLGSLVVGLIFFISGGVGNANLITNGDFSDGLLGWEASGRVGVESFEGIPQVHHNSWDLSTWNDQMDGRFALYEGGSILTGRTTDVPDSSSFSFFFDYAAAWERFGGTDPTPQSNDDDYGFLRLQIDFVTRDGMRYSPMYKEIVWGPSVGTEKDVITGSFYTEIFTRNDIGLEEIIWSIDTHNPNHTLNQIAGIDNVNLMPAPIPEPSSMFLLGLGLAGLTIFRWKFKR